jgi:integrase
MIFGAARCSSVSVFRAEQKALLIRLVSDCVSRRGELVAFRTTDLRGRVLNLRRASQDGVIASIKKGHMSLGKGAARYWKEHVRRWGQYLPADDAAGPRWLFRARPDRTTPLLPNGLGQRFDKLADAAGLTEASLHRIRHTVATYLVAQGKIMQASARLRHSDVSTTLRVYAHVLTLDDEDVADGLAELYGLTTPDTTSEEHTSLLDVMGGW